MYDKKFYLLLEYVFADEGGYSNRKNDRGKETNFGITQLALDEYTRKRNLPRKSVRDLTKDETMKIYYEDYYLKSGADKVKDIREAYLLFDTAVNFHPITARKMYKKAGGDFYKMLNIRLSEHLKEIEKYPEQKEFKQGWLNRVDNIEKRADKLIQDSDFRPSYADDLTPFDDNYSGSLRKVTDDDLKNVKSPNGLDKKEHFRNKYLYELHKTGVPAGFAANLQDDYDFDENYFDEDADYAQPMSLRERLLQSRQEKLARYTQKLAQTPEEIAELESKHVSLEELKAPQEAKKQKLRNIIEGKVEFDENADFSSYENKKSGDNKIFTQEDIDEMSEEEREKNKDAIFYQKQTIGVPTREQAQKSAAKGGMIHVEAYTRKDGTKVRSYYRSR